MAANQEGKITLFNQAAEELFQYSLEEVIDQLIKILLRESIGDIHQEKCINFCPRVLASAATLENEQNGPSDAKTAASIVKITERKQIEAALKKSEERYRLFLQNFTGIAYRGTIGATPEFYHGAVKEITGIQHRNS